MPIAAAGSGFIRGHTASSTPRATAPRMGRQHSIAPVSQRRVFDDDQGPRLPRAMTLIGFWPMDAAAEHSAFGLLPASGLGR
jgi:hypothetical protein